MRTISRVVSPHRPVECRSYNFSKVAPPQTMERPDVYIAVRQATLHWRNAKGRWRRWRREQFRTRIRSGRRHRARRLPRLAVTNSKLKPDGSRNGRMPQDDPE